MLLAVGIGSNDETFAPIVGSKRLTINQSVLLGGFILIFGAIFLGINVAKTVGTGIVTIIFSQSQILVILLSVALMLILSSWKGLPISTTHAMVGSTIALAIITKSSSQNLSYIINFSKVYSIIFSWIISPIMGLVGSFLIMKLLLIIKKWYIKGLDDVDKLETIFATALIGAVVLTAFSRGANDVSNAVAPLMQSYISLSKSYGNSLIERIPLLLGGIFMAIGLILIGRRVLKTLGNDVVELSPTTALSVQIATALTTFVAAYLGIPISGTHVLVSAFVGTGIATRSRLNTSTIKKIALSAIGTPFLAALSTIIFWNLFLLI